MDIAMIGLGKMDANMAKRLLHGGHRVVAYDIQAAEADGADGARTLDEVVAKLNAPRIVWVMVPSGKPTDDTIAALAERLDPGDTIIDGGNSNDKETAQNILFFRFFNTISDPVWNRNYVDNIQITAAESVDVNHRVGYYDQAGVLRDMFQNHMLQLLSLVTMEPPASFGADDIRNEKVKVLQAIRPVNLHETVRGQYDGYAQADGVAQDSQTATFAAIKLHIDNWRWKGVPVHLRSGKALPQKTNEIIIEFQEPPHLMFDLPADYDFTPNILVICIQPDEGIHLKFETKVPDAVGETRSVDMEFHYRSSFEDRALPDAYERLLLDAIHGGADDTTCIGDKVGNIQDAVRMHPVFSCIGGRNIRPLQDQLRPQ